MNKEKSSHSDSLRDMRNLTENGFELRKASAGSMNVFFNNEFVASFWENRINNKRINFYIHDDKPPYIMHVTEFIRLFKLKSFL